MSVAGLAPHVHRSPSHASIARWSAMDMWVLVYLFCFVANPQVPGWQISPISWFVLASLAALAFSARPLFTAIAAPQCRYLVLYAFLLLTDWSIAVACGTRQRMTGVVQLSMLAAAVYVLWYGRTQTGLDRIVVLYIAVLMASMVVFLLGVYSATFMRHVARFFPVGDPDVDATARGLSRGLHIVGYQVSALVLYLVVCLPFSRGVVRRATYGVGAVLCMLALFVQGTRSGMAGLAVALLVVCLVNARFRRLAIPVCVLVVGLGVLANAASLQCRAVAIDAAWLQRRGVLGERIRGELDVGTRLDVMRVGLRSVVRYPLGLPISRAEWGELLREGSDSFGGEESTIGVHNAFLAFALANGAIPGLAAISLAAYGAVVALRCLRWASTNSRAPLNASILPACYFADLVNSFFHHAWFLNEPVSAAVFFLLMAQYGLCRRQSVQTLVLAVARDGNARAVGERVAAGAV